MSSSASSSSGMDPRLLRLLHWSLAQQGGADGDDGDGNAISNDRSKDVREKTLEEKKSDMAWLQGALSDSGNLISDPVDQMKILISVLDDENFPTGEKIKALENLRDFVENIDLASDFATLGGLERAIGYVMRGSGSDGDALGTAACDVLAIAVQNHPSNQAAAHALGALPILVRAVKRKDASEENRAKALTAISCLVRGCEHSADEFMRTHSGLKLLIDIAASRLPDCSVSVRSKRKALFLLTFFAERMRENQPPYTRSSELQKLCEKTLRECILKDKDAGVKEHAERLAEVLTSLNDALPREGTAATAPSKIPFIATSEYADVLDHHILPGGLEVKINVTSGKKQARLLRKSDGDKSVGSSVAEASKMQLSHSVDEKMAR